MDTRREFFKRVASLAGGTVLAESLLPAIERAAAISPASESSYLQAEHVVILMQENRSFDHCFGALRGVRGFNDPRAVTLPNGNPVWLQSDAHGQTYAPFRLDATRSNATWLGSLPHSWTDQVDAKNHGNHDGWLSAKQTRNEHVPGMPLTMGHYTREDLPFYYALADAFTVCDQHFCSSLTGTTPNRLYLWTGTIREQQDITSRAHTRNEDVDFDAPARWSTFPERLEDAGVSWKIYQNELCLPSGLSEQEDAWLSNFSDNPIEWFPQFAVEYAPQHRAFLPQLEASLRHSIERLELRLVAASALTDSERVQVTEQLEKERDLLRRAIDRSKMLDGKSLGDQSDRTQALHRSAFVTNAGDPQYRSLTPLPVAGTEGEVMQIPQGDILHQFRRDAEADRLPAVSWIVAPEKFSDHPTSPWFGAWYVAEVLNILTQNPELWKKTIFILTYDENDGFFDHMPPFAAPVPGQPETGLASEGIDTSVEHVSLELDAQHAKAGHARGGSIGLGFRVPMIVASPWSRGGAVCSQVFDHTSVLQFLEGFASHRSGTVVRETNISQWRRTVCGDLSATFESASAPSRVQPAAPLPFPEKTAFLTAVQKAARQPTPHYAALTDEQIARERSRPARASSIVPQQEEGIRPARALPYHLAASGFVNGEEQALVITMAAGNVAFGSRAAGAPFHVYALMGFQNGGEAQRRVRSYAVKAGDTVQDHWHLQDFGHDGYHLSINGPNGFLCALRGDPGDPSVLAEASWVANGEKPVLGLRLRNNSRSRREFRVWHHAYSYEAGLHSVRPQTEVTIHLPLQRSFGWYDLSITVHGFPKYERRYAGHVETGAPSFSDPQIGSFLV